MKLTQQVVAEHLGLSQSQVSSWLRTLDLDVEKNTLDEIRLAYIAALRAEASSAAPSSEREQWYRVRRKREELRLARDERQLVSTDYIIRAFSAVVHAVKQRVFGIPSRLAPMLVAEANPARIDELIHTALVEAFEAMNEKRINQVIADACDQGEERKNGSTQPREARP